MTSTKSEKMKKEFNDKLCELISNKGGNRGYLSNEKYVLLKNEIKELKIKELKRTRRKSQMIIKN